MGELRQLVGTRPLFSIGVSIVLLNDQGEWLLQRRSDSGLWGIPGGGAEAGESFEQAAARELYEETGLTGVLLTPAESVSGPEMHHVYPHGDEIYLVGQTFRGVLSDAHFAQATLGTDGETLELKFFGLNELPVLSGAIERHFAGVLRSEAGLPALPEHPSPAVVPAAQGEHLAELRAIVGTRPLFAPGAAVLVYDEQNHLLLVQHTDTGLWILPGSGMKLGETFEQCARREVERLGLQAERLDELHVYIGAEYRFAAPNGDVTDPVVMLYRARGVGGTLRLPRSEFRWVAPEEFPAPDELSGPLVLAMVKRTLGFLAEPRGI
jgi:8-oxo-dGTP diphosphatase